MAQTGVRDMIKRQANKAGIDKRVHPHDLRHTHAMELTRTWRPRRSMSITWALKT